MRPTRRQFLASLVPGVGVLAGCQGNGNVSLLGYSTEPPFDPTIRSVSIPIFKNPVFHTAPYRGIEVDITQAIVREINGRRTPMRVESDPAKADTELVGSVYNITKAVQNRNLLNFTREFDVIISCEVVWRDLRTGRSLAYTRPLPPPPQTDHPFDPSLEAPPPPGPDVVPGSAIVSGYGRVLPELGESNTTGAQAAVKQIAKQIVNMMERPW